MFLRRLRQDGDVVAAAQRRLAALAQQHLRADTLDDEGGMTADGPPATSPVPGPAGGRSSTPSRAPDGDGARHVAVGRTELGRWGVTGQHVTVAALCLVLLVALAAWWALRSAPHADQVTLSASRTTPTAPSSATGGGDSSVVGQPQPTAAPIGSPSVGGVATGRLVVDVAGRVRRPGIVELPPGSRVVDAIAAAGGVRPGVGLTSLNLARLLVDGEQILVGVRVPTGGGLPPAPSATAASTTAIAPIELNSASIQQLDTLPGIGPVTAQAIIQWRADNGPFTSVNELLEVSGIGDVTLADIRPYVYV